jgi:hypothetical protein
MLPTAVLPNCGMSANLNIGILLNMITKLNILHQNPQLGKATDRCASFPNTTQQIKIEEYIFHINYNVS